MLRLVRHGEATANRSGLLLGRTDAALTSHGRQQIQAIAAWFEQRDVAVGTIKTSPLTRAAETAGAIGNAVGSDPIVDERWIEIDYGSYEGTPLSDVPAEIWTKWQSDPHHRPAGGESLVDLGSRVRGACDELFDDPGGPARSGDVDLVVVSHVSPIKAAVAWALGADDLLAWKLRLSTGSITSIGWGPTGPVVEGFNIVPSKVALSPTVRS